MWFYNLLLRLYPASFRNEYGEDMRSIFARRHRQARGPGVVAFWLSTTGEVLGNAVLVHFDILRQDLGYTVRVARCGSIRSLR